MNNHEPLPFGENGEASAKEVPNEGPAQRAGYVWMPCARQGQGPLATLAIVTRMGRDRRARRQSLRARSAKGRIAQVQDSKNRKTCARLAI